MSYHDGYRQGYRDARRDLDRRPNSFESAVGCLGEFVVALGVGAAALIVVVVLILAFRPAHEADIDPETSKPVRKQNGTTDPNRNIRWEKDKPVK